jgi:hypothetical protein
MEESGDHRKPHTACVAVVSKHHRRIPLRAVITYPPVDALPPCFRRTAQPSRLAAGSSCRASLQLRTTLEHEHDRWHRCTGLPDASRLLAQFIAPMRPVWPVIVRTCISNQYSVRKQADARHSLPVSKCYYPRSGRCLQMFQLQHESRLVTMKLRCRSRCFPGCIAWSPASRIRSDKRVKVSFNRTAHHGCLGVPQVHVRPQSNAQRVQDRPVQ